MWSTPRYATLGCAPKEVGGAKDEPSSCRAPPAPPSSPETGYAGEAGGEAETRLSRPDLPESPPVLCTTSEDEDGCKIHERAIRPVESNAAIDAAPLMESLPPDADRWLSRSGGNRWYSTLLRSHRAEINAGTDPAFMAPSAKQETDDVRRLFVGECAWSQRPCGLPYPLPKFIAIVNLHGTRAVLHSETEALLVALVNLPHPIKPIREEDRTGGLQMLVAARGHGAATTGSETTRPAEPSVERSVVLYYSAPKHADLGERHYEARMLVRRSSWAETAPCSRTTILDHRFVVEDGQAMITPSDPWPRPAGSTATRVASCDGRRAKVTRRAKMPVEWTSVVDMDADNDFDGPLRSDVHHAANQVSVARNLMQEERDRCAALVKNVEVEANRRVECLLEKKDRLAAEAKAEHARIDLLRDAELVECKQARVKAERALASARKSHARAEHQRTEARCTAEENNEATRTARVETLEEIARLQKELDLAKSALSTHLVEEGRLSKALAEASVANQLASKGHDETEAEHTAQLARAREDARNRVKRARQEERRKAEVLTSQAVTRAIEAATARPKVVHVATATDEETKEMVGVVEAPSDTTKTTATTTVACGTSDVRTSEGSTQTTVNAQRPPAAKSHSTSVACTQTDDAPNFATGSEGFYGAHPYEEFAGYHPHANHPRDGRYMHDTQIGQSVERLRALETHVEHMNTAMAAMNFQIQSQATAGMHHPAFFPGAHGDSPVGFVGVGPLSPPRQDMHTFASDRAYTPHTFVPAEVSRAQHRRRGGC